MTLFGWAMLFVGLVIVGLGVLALIVLKLWRGFKALGRDAARASEALSHVGGRFSDSR